MTLYDRLVAAGAQLDSHESDLYVKDAPEALALVRASGLSFSYFKHAGDRTIWIEVPFAYMPFWRRRESPPRKESTE